MSFNYGNKVLFKPHTNKRAICEPTVWLLQLDIKGLYTSKMAPWHVKNSTPRGVGGAILYMIPECNRAFGQCGYKSHLDTKLTKHRPWQQQLHMPSTDSTARVWQQQLHVQVINSSKGMCFSLEKSLVIFWKQTKKYWNTIPLLAGFYLWQSRVPNEPLLWLLCKLITAKNDVKMII